MADDGELMGSHVSSSREWGQHDVGPTSRKLRDAYAAKFGPGYEDRIEYVVLPHGEAPPVEVLQRQHARAEVDGGDRS